MYEKYLDIKAVPAGAILGRILKKEGLSQLKLAQLTGIAPQRINDLISGRRRFTPESSLKIEKCLPITKTGYFYIIQSNNDIYIFDNKLNHKPLPQGIRRQVFWDCRIEELDIERNKRFIINRIFTYGNDEEIALIVSLYGKDQVLKELQSDPSTWKSSIKSINIDKHLK